MDYFKKYVSNTYGGSGNQLFFEMEEGDMRTSLVFYKITESGEYDYSFLFSNIIDSTFADGAVSHNNLILRPWKILSAKVGKCEQISAPQNISEWILSKEEIQDINLKSVTFDGKLWKNVMPGEFFPSDGVNLNFKKGEYLCLELTFSGRMIPYHEESLLPIFEHRDGKWVYNKKMPLPGMIGCRRSVKGRIAYLGDSITQGIGTPVNSYEHWNVITSEKIGSDYAYWNLGIGYGRASDAASDGAWLYKAKQNDIVVVCYGVNDIMQGGSAQKLKRDLKSIAEKLKKENIKVMFQTIPPFDYEGEKISIWQEVNKYIKEELALEVDMVFDAASYLSENDEKPHNAKFGGHPDSCGCKIWGDALGEEFSCLLKKL